MTESDLRAERSIAARYKRLPILQRLYVDGIIKSRREACRRLGAEHLYVTEYQLLFEETVRMAETMTTEQAREELAGIPCRKFKAEPPRWGSPLAPVIVHVKS